MEAQASTSDGVDCMIINNEPYREIDKRFAAKEKKVEPLKRHDIFLIVILCLFQFLTSMAYAILTVFYPQAAENKGVSSSEVGYVFSAFYLGTLLFSPVIGFLITKVGTKSVMTVSLFVSSLVLILFAFTDRFDSTSYFLGSCLILRVLQGLGMVGVQTSTFTIVAHQFEGRVGTLTGLLEMCVGIGYSLSSMIGGVLYEWGGYSVPFYFLFSFAVLATFLCWKFIPDSDAHRGKYLRFESFNERVTTTVEISINLFLRDSSDHHFSTVVVHTHICVTIYVHNLPHFRIKYWVVDKCQLCLLHHTHTTNRHDLGQNESFRAIRAEGLQSNILLGRLEGKRSRGRPRKKWLDVVKKWGRFTKVSSLVTTAKDGVKWKSVVVLSLGIVAQVMVGLGMVPAYIPMYKYIQSHARECGFENSFHTSAMIATLLTATQAFGSIAGPIIGGQIIQNAGYNWAFNIFGLLVYIGALIVLIDGIREHLKSRKSNTNIDTETAPLVTNA
ncbi:MFS-type transporter SLC18B1 [Nymphon striatum]|nr:MFS-type transporter SLC18B1 [Nymphon striatum]